MKKCICTTDFKMNHNSFKWNIPFYKDKEYQYVTTIHSETGIKIYHVGNIDNEIEDIAFQTVPFTEDKFRKLFDNREEDREEKINQILN